MFWSGWTSVIEFEGGSVGEAGGSLSREITLPSPLHPPTPHHPLAASTRGDLNRRVRPLLQSLRRSSIPRGQHHVHGQVAVPEYFFGYGSHEQLEGGAATVRTQAKRMGAKLAGVLN